MVGSEWPGPCHFVLSDGGTGERACEAVIEMYEISPIVGSAFVLRSKRGNQEVGDGAQKTARRRPGSKERRQRHAVLGQVPAGAPPPLAARP